MSSKLWGRAALGLALLVAAGHASAAPGDPKLGLEKYTLPNGLEVILVPDPSVPVVAVDVWYHVGSGYEVSGRSGFAHLFEHMVFQGSRNVGSDRHHTTLKQIGGTAVNGTTNADRTDYREVVPSNQLETALWLESDRMGYLLDDATFTKQSLANQIDVVRNERRQNYDNQPYGKARFALHAALYPEGHPYRYLTIGKHDDLTAASLDDVKRFFKTWYVPSNATLALVGDFDVAEAKQLVAKWFATFPRSTRPKVVAVPAPAIRPTEVTIDDDDFAKLRRITFAWHAPALFAAGDAELDIAASALAQEGPGRLYRALVYDRAVAQTVQASQRGATFSGIFSISVTLRGGAELDEVRKLVAAEVARLAREPLPDAAIARVVIQNEAAAVRRLESALGRAEAVQQYNHYLGDPDRLTWDLDRYRSATAEQIRAAVARYLVPDRMVTIVTNPPARGPR